MRLLVLLFYLSFGVAQAQNKTPSVPIGTGSRIVVIGNGLAERLDLFGYWETRLHQRFLNNQLVVRNLGRAGDEVGLRLRSLGFELHGHELNDHRPDVLIAMFGFNESFAGEEGVASFRQQFEAFVHSTVSTSYNSTKPPFLVVCSPIPHEDLHQDGLIDGRTNNERMLLYSAAMRQVCDDYSTVAYVDVWGPMLDAIADPISDLTFNGIHLNDQGQRIFADVLDQAIFGKTSLGNVPPPWNDPYTTTIRNAVLEKNRQFFYDYRAVNGFYISGGRKEPYGVKNFPGEFAKLRRMIEVRDQRIWDAASGKPLSRTIDDSATGDLPQVPSNLAKPPRLTSPQESLAKFKPAEGFEVELVASEVEFPDLKNPVAMQFDNRGRLWISTMPSYPMYAPGKMPNDKLLILEDSNGDGRMDRQTVFADNLYLPLGFALGDGGVYLAQPPNVVFLKDSDGDDRADSAETILHGFDTADSHHAISVFRWSPSGKLQFQEGTFHQSQVETPHGPRRVSDGAVYQFDPESYALDVFASYPFANPWGLCFDRWGQSFIADASTGASYFATAISGDVIYPDKHRTLKPLFDPQWRPVCGCTIVSSSNFPDTMQGDYLVNNTIGLLGTLQYKLKDSGSGFIATANTPLLTSSDSNFRPVDLGFGLDGALYIVDWYNPLIGHMQHSLRDPYRDTSHGRIWRVRYRDKPLQSPPPIAAEPVENLVPLLGAYDAAVRAAARNELRLHSASHVDGVLQLWLDSLSSNDEPEISEFIEHAQLEALWVKQHHNLIDAQLLVNALQANDFRVRAASVRVLCDWRDQIPQATQLLQLAAQDSHPRVRLEAVRAASFLNPSPGQQIIRYATQQPLDSNLQYAATESLHTLRRRAGLPYSADTQLIEALSLGNVAENQVVVATKFVAELCTEEEFAKVTIGVLQGDYSSSVKAEALQSIRSIAIARQFQPKIATSFLYPHLSTAFAKNDDPLAISLLSMIGQWQIEGLEPLILEQIKNDTTDLKILKASLVALAQMQSESSRRFIVSLSNESISPHVLLSAIAALSSSDRSIASQLLSSYLRSQQPVESELLQDALAAWLDHREADEQLEKLLSASPDLSAEFKKLLLRAILGSGRSAQKSTRWLQDGTTMKDSLIEIESLDRDDFIKQIVNAGSIASGREIYLRSELQCTKCHRNDESRGQTDASWVGPDLSNIGADTSIEYLLESVIDPSRQIKEIYATRNLLLVNGRVVCGIVLDRDASRIVLRHDHGNIDTFALQDVESETAGRSLMPQGLAQLMTKDELRDLIAYLASLRLNRSPIDR